jgi:hypothetical protein
MRALKDFMHASNKLMHAIIELIETNNSIDDIFKQLKILSLFEFILI